MLVFLHTHTDTQGKFVNMNNHTLSVKLVIYHYIISDNLFTHAQTHLMAATHWMYVLVVDMDVFLANSSIKKSMSLA